MFLRLLPAGLGRCQTSLGDLRKLGYWPCPGVAGCFTLGPDSVEPSGASWTWQDVVRGESKSTPQSSQEFT